jgi:hypothetical protein
LNRSQAVGAANHLFVELFKPSWVKRSTRQLGFTFSAFSCCYCGCRGLGAVVTAAAAVTAVLLQLLCTVSVGSVILLCWLLLLLLALSSTGPFQLLQPSILQQQQSGVSQKWCTRPFIS